MDLYTSIGHLAVNWASAEFALDQIIRCVHMDYGGDKIEPATPQPFNRKPPYLRKAYAANSDLTRFIPRLEELLAETSQLAEQRHWCIHGYIMAVDVAGKFPMGRMKHGVEPKSQHRKFSAKQIDRLSIRCLQLFLDILMFGIESVRIIEHDRADQITREFLRKKGITLPDGKLFG